MVTPKFSVDSPVEPSTRDPSPVRNLEQSGYHPISKAPARNAFPWERASFAALTGGIGGAAAPIHQSPSSARLGRHFFPDRAESLRDLSALADLVDDRSNWYEDSRKTDDEIRRICNAAPRKVRSGLREYYERVNEILDGWREVDLVVESQFPAEVLKRFGSLEEAEAALGRRLNGDALSDESEQDTDDEPEERERGRRGSLTRSASNLFSGFWFGNQRDATPKKKRDLEHEAASAALLGASPRGRIGSISNGAAAAAAAGGNRSQSPRRNNYGAIKSSPSNLSSSFVAPQGLTAIHDADEDAASVKSGGAVAAALEEAPSTPPSSSDKLKASVVRSRTPRGTRISALENIPPSKRKEVANGSSKRKSILEEDDTEGDEETETDEGEVEGSLDRRLARQRAERKAREKDRVVSIPGGPDVHLREERSISADRRTDQTTASSVRGVASVPGGMNERERRKLLDHVPGLAERDEEEDRKENFAININLAANVLLLGGKGFAVISSNSVSLIASFVDSALDLLSTLIIFITTRAVNYRSYHTYIKYPTGKRRFGPLGVVIFSVLMIASFAQVLVESVQRLMAVIRTGSDPEEAASLPFIGIAFMLLTIGIKLFMWLIYRTSRSSGVRAVAQDAENDVVFNIASLIFPIVGAKLGWPALDPIGGICLSIYIIVEWIGTLLETVARLSGAVAETEDIARALYMITRFRSVKAVAAFELYHSGDDMIVEADIVLPATLALKEAHDLGEIVTYCAESLDQVERAYIHLDYAPQGPPGHLSQRG